MKPVLGKSLGCIDLKTPLTVSQRTRNDQWAFTKNAGTGAGDMAAHEYHSDWQALGIRTQVQLVGS